MKTVGDLRKLIADLPDHMPVEFSPITNAWLGANEPMRARDIHIYDAKGWKSSTVEDPTAKVSIYLYEEE